MPSAVWWSSTDTFLHRRCRFADTTAGEANRKSTSPPGVLGASHASPADSSLLRKQKALHSPNHSAQSAWHRPLQSSLLTKCWSFVRNWSKWLTKLRTKSTKKLYLANRRHRSKDFSQDDYTPVWWWPFWISCLSRYLTEQRLNNCAVAAILAQVLQMGLTSWPRAPACI